MGNSACHTKMKTFTTKEDDDVESLPPCPAETPDKDQVKVLPHDPRSPSDGIVRTPIQITDIPGEIGDQNILMDCQFTPTGNFRPGLLHDSNDLPASQRIGPPYYLKDLESIDGVESDGDEGASGESQLLKSDHRVDRLDNPARKNHPRCLPSLPLRFGPRGSRNPGSPSDLVREKQRRECKERVAWKENKPPTNEATIAERTNE